MRGLLGAINQNQVKNSVGERQFRYLGNNLKLSDRQKVVIERSDFIHAQITSNNMLRAIRKKKSQC